MLSRWSFVYLQQDTTGTCYLLQCDNRYRMRNIRITVFALLLCTYIYAYFSIGWISLMDISSHIYFVYTHMHTLTHTHTHTHTRTHTHTHTHTVWYIHHVHPLSIGTTYTIHTHNPGQIRHSVVIFVSSIYCTDAKPSITDLVLSVCLVKHNGWLWSMGVSDRLWYLVCNLITSRCEITPGTSPPHTRNC